MLSLYTKVGAGARMKVVSNMVGDMIELNKGKHMSWPMMSFVHQPERIGLLFIIVPCRLNIAVDALACVSNLLKLS
jgi:hypothetical protein